MSHRQNRKSVRALAKASGLTYEEAKSRMFHLCFETPLSRVLTEDLIQRIQDRAQPQIVSFRKADA